MALTVSLLASLLHLTHGVGKFETDETLMSATEAARQR